MVAPEMKMVPREPSEAMINAGQVAEWTRDDRNSRIAGIIWRAMYDAWAASQPARERDSRSFVAGHLGYGSDTTASQPEGALTSKDIGEVVRLAGIHHLPIKGSEDKGRHMTAKDDALVAALRDQTQCDYDGRYCIVSRQACDEAITLIEELRKDAERYRHLREHIEIGSGAGGFDRWAIDLPDPGVALDTSEVFDAAIDAAIAAKEG